MVSVNVYTKASDVGGRMKQTVSLDKKWHASDFSCIHNNSVQGIHLRRSVLNQDYLLEL